MRKRLLIGAAVAAALMLAGGIAYAQTTGDGTIKACAKSETGQLRLDTGNGCLPTESAVQWNQTGPQGPSGTSHVDEWAWYKGPSGAIPIVSGVWPAIRDHETTVATFRLQPGQYLVTTEVIAVNNDGQGVVVCQTGNNNLGISLLQGAVGQGSGMAIQQTLSSQTVFVVPATQDLTVQCFNAPPNEPSGNPFINLVDVLATKIDSSSFTDLSSN